MEIVENPELERRIMGVIKDVIYTHREGWHVTDLIRCPRKTWFRLMGYKGEPKEEQEIAMLVGRVLHAFLEKIGWIREHVVKKDDIIGTIDVLLDNNEIVEIKTTRRWKVQVKDMRSWIRQMSAYTYMKGEESCDLAVLFTNRATVKAWTLNFKLKELEENWRKIVETKKMLQKHMLEKKFPKQRGEAWECKNCAYRRHCLVLSHVWRW